MKWRGPICCIISLWEAKSNGPRGTNSMGCTLRFTTWIQLHRMVVKKSQNAIYCCPSRHNASRCWVLRLGRWNKLDPRLGGRGHQGSVLPLTIGAWKSGDFKRIPPTYLSKLGEALEWPWVTIEQWGLSQCPVDQERRDQGQRESSASSSHGSQGSPLNHRLSSLVSSPTQKRIPWLKRHRYKPPQTRACQLTSVLPF
jgi:hypothetical protein